MKTFVKHSDLVRCASADHKKIGKVAAESVFKHTGKNWNQWIEALDRAGARSWTYREIVVFLKKKYRLSSWWQQGVALGFEIAIGRRKEGQDSRGRYMVTATKSFPCAVQTVWKIVTSRQGQQIWLKPLSAVVFRPKSQFETEDGFYGEIRTVARFRRLRFHWHDPQSNTKTVVELLFVTKPGFKSILVFNHTEIKDIKTQLQLRSRWREAADRIFDLLSQKAEKKTSPSRKSPDMS